MPPTTVKTFTFLCHGFSHDNIHGFTHAISFPFLCHGFSHDNIHEFTHAMSFPMQIRHSGCHGFSHATCHNDADDDNSDEDDDDDDDIVFPIVACVMNAKNDIRDVGSTADLVLVFFVHLVQWYLVHWYQTLTRCLI